MLSLEGSPSAHGTGKRNDLVRHLLRADRMNGDDLFAILNDPALRPRNVTRLVKDYLDDLRRQVVRVEFPQPQWRAVTDRCPALVDIFYCAPIWLYRAFGGTIAVNGRNATNASDFLPYLKTGPRNKTWASIVLNAGLGRRARHAGLNPLDGTRLKLLAAWPQDGRRGAVEPREELIEDAVRMFHEAAGLDFGALPDEYEADMRRWFRKADDHFATASAKLGKAAN